MGLTDWLADRGHGEIEHEKYHYPEYTKGCWGNPSHRLCWFCRFRYITAIYRIFRRTR